jgi:NAD(P)-dependent dehydrogenase (short-subunit alcohol dehydrogenase family)
LAFRDGRKQEEIPGCWPGFAAQHVRRGSPQVVTLAARSNLAAVSGMTSRFDGKVVLVTGGASGIGLATAQRFAQDGARVVISDVSVQAGEAAANAIRQLGGGATFVRCDVSAQDEVEAMVRRTLELYGGLDYAFNNAGIEGALAPTADYAPDAWRRVLDVNLVGVFYCMRAEIPHLIARGGGAIVNMASILGTVAFANAGAYTASKHGVIGLTRAAALEYADRGIRINVVCPGFIETPMVMERGVQAGARPDVRRQLEELHPMKRLGRPEEVAAAVAFLCSDDSSFMTGHPLLVDGGYVAR